MGRYDRDRNESGYDYPSFGESARDMGHRDYGYSRGGLTSRSNSSYRDTDFGMRGTPSEPRWMGGEKFSRNEDYFANGNDERRYGSTDRGHFGKGPKGWRRSDERILEEACEALYHDHDVDASDIEVSVKDACVSLRGTVPSRDMKRAAEYCVEHLSGVRDVQNELRVQRPMINKATVESLM